MSDEKTNRLSRREQIRKSLRDNTKYTSILTAGVSALVMGVMALLVTPPEQDAYALAIMGIGISFIIASIVGLIMASQTDEIAARIYERFDRQDELAERRHQEMISVLKEISNKLDALDKLDKLDVMDSKLDVIVNKLDTIDNNTTTKLDVIVNKLDTIDNNTTTKLDVIVNKLDTIDSKLDTIDNNTRPSNA